MQTTAEDDPFVTCESNGTSIIFFDRPYNIEAHTNVIIDDFKAGFEYHFASTKRLSPYVALDIGIGSGSMSYEGNNSNGSNYNANYTSNEEYAMIMSENMSEGTIDSEDSEEIEITAQVNLDLTGLENVVANFWRFGLWF